jgi:hypothetical protein
MSLGNIETRARTREMEVTSLDEGKQYCKQSPGCPWRRERIQKSNFNGVLEEGRDQQEGQ